MAKLIKSMDQQTQSRTAGSYTANLLGNIRSHMAGLKGYDVMALELIQNADDAKADCVVFEVTDSGLKVSNSGQFTYCGDLTKECGHLVSNSYSCDYHRIADVGSGGKLSRSQNIGRFGIGFVSTYQITDHPQILSNNVKLTLHPEEGKWFFEPCEQAEGTTFFLPWASDRNSKARRALGISHVSEDHIECLLDDLKKVLRKSLLFLRHVRTAEVRRNGELLLACKLDRGDGNELKVSFSPANEVERWHILRTDAGKDAAPLFALHQQLESLGRSTNISIGVRIEPEPLSQGLLYAFLPTEQSTGLPVHINADFFPEADRKAIIFVGRQHEQAWNEMLIGAAAAELAKDPEGLRNMLGDVQFWKILKEAHGLSRSSTHPSCFRRFWEQLKVTATRAHIALAQDGSVERPSSVFLPSRGYPTEQQSQTLLEIGGRFVAEKIDSFRNTICELGAPKLTLDRLVGLLEGDKSQQALRKAHINPSRLESFYRSLWQMVNDLLPETATQAAPEINRLRAIPFLVSENLCPVSINDLFLAPQPLVAERVASLLPELEIATHHLLGFSKIEREIRRLKLDSVVLHIKRLHDRQQFQNVIGGESTKLRELYAMLADLDRKNYVENPQTVYYMLRNLPIWLSSRGLVKATQALLPGNFTDPTGQADLLEPSILTDSAREFVLNKLGVQTQTIEAFVEKVLPRFFNKDGPLDTQNYTRLITELAKYPTLVNDENIRRVLGKLPIVPTQDGAWSRPTNTYRRAEDLIQVLGDATHLWLDASRVPDSQTVHTFIDSLGILRSPLAQHLVDRMLSIARVYPPTEDAKRASGDAFYFLCDKYEEWRRNPSFQVEINKLRGVACFPAEDDRNSWHSVGDLHAPYRAEAFRSQAKILDFRNTARLRTELLEDLGVTINPKTKLVIDHLKFCISTGTRPHISTYQVLNERAQSSDAEVSTLAGSRCIYVRGEQGFVRPNQIYWSTQRLGRYAFTITSDYEAFKPLFRAIGVKDAPEGRDYVDILLDIVGEYSKQSKPVEGEDRSVYDNCLMGVKAADEHEAICASHIRGMQDAPTILNLFGQPVRPQDVLIRDSEWHAGFFEGELDQALCKPISELWSFFRKLGCKRLSESARVELESVDGQEKDESQLARKLEDRVDIFTRLLSDKPESVKQKVREALSCLTAVSSETVRIQASVKIGTRDWRTDPRPAVAFYDTQKRQLVLARPVVDSSWPSILNAIFHQLMPEESGTEISKLTLSIRPLIGLPVEDAHRELTDAGIPRLDTESPAGQSANLISGVLDTMEGGTGGNAGIKPDCAPADAPNDEGAEVTHERPNTPLAKGELKTGRNVTMPDQRQHETERTGSHGQDAITGGLSSGQSQGKGASTDNKSDISINGESTTREVTGAWFPTTDPTPSDKNEDIAMARDLLKRFKEGRLVEKTDEKFSQDPDDDREPDFEPLGSPGDKFMPKPSRYEYPTQITNNDEKLFDRLIRRVDWSYHLLRYKYARSGGESNLRHVYYFIRQVSDALSSAIKHNGNNGFDYGLIAESICIWGGVPKPSGYNNARIVIQEALKSSVSVKPSAGVPMDSGWTKVAAAATFDADYELQQTIWDSRVANAVIDLLDQELCSDSSELRKEDFPWCEQLCLIQSLSKARNERIAKLGRRWWIKSVSDDEGHWRGHLVGSWVVRRIVDALKRDTGLSRFPVNSLRGKVGEDLSEAQQEWNTFNVGLALFMLGK
jgi:hypothetical protein